MGVVVCHSTTSIFFVLYRDNVSFQHLGVKNEAELVYYRILTKTAKQKYYHENSCSQKCIIYVICSPCYIKSRLFMLIIIFHAPT